MYLFVSAKIFKCEYPAHVTFEKDKTRIDILNLTDFPNNGSEHIEIEIPFVHDPLYVFQENLCCKVILTTREENKYIFESDNSDNVCAEDCIYALIRSDVYREPSEIYIPSESGDKIEILKQFNFCGHSFLPENNFLDKMYFVKIHLSAEEPLSLYFSTEKAEHLRDYITILYNDFGLSAGNGTTYIKKKQDYIKLSELVKN